MFGAEKGFGNEGFGVDPREFLGGDSETPGDPGLGCLFS